MSANAEAQCSTDDADMNGVPDDCPAGSNYIAGSPVGDFLFGTNGPDCIFGFAGNDLILGGGGNDHICAGEGNDTIGSDSFFGGGGNDFVFGGSGDDTIFGGIGDDALFGESGSDSIFGGSGNDSLSGQDDDDALNGGSGDDALSGGDGIDTLDGGGGTNTCVEEVPGTSERLQNCTLITYAAVSRFDLLESGGGFSVTWETTTEVGVVAFRVWRLDADGALHWVGEVAASPEGSPHGARYFLRDDAAPRLDVLEYLIEERTVSGASVQYGPFARSPVPATRRDAFLQSRQSGGRTPRAVPLQRHRLPTVTQSKIRRKTLEVPDGAVLVVDQTGIIEVDAATLADALGVSNEVVAGLIRSGGLHLSLGGESIAWHAFGDGDALRFLASEVRSPFSRRHRYLVTVGDGVTMETRTVAQGEAVEPHTFLETTRLEENVFPGPSGGPDPRRDLFFWHALTSEAQAAIFVPLSGLVGSAARELRVVVHAATEHPEQPHRVELHWNGQSIGTFDLVGRTRHTLVVSLKELPARDENELIVQHHGAGEAPPVLYVDAVEVDYDRIAEADEPTFVFGGAEDGAHSIAGLTSETAHLYDWTDPSAPSYFGEVVLEVPGRLRFNADRADRRFVVAAPDAISAPLEVTPHSVAGLRSTTRSADYVIIAASHLVTEAQALADYRKADGYRVLLVDIDDVFWEFADGEPDPLAIRDFLAFAAQSWETAPRFATLVGRSNLDYRDLLGLGGNWLPSPLAATEGGLFPSDSMLGDITGHDGVPEIAIGRLPVTTGDELMRIVDAIRYFEANHESMDALFAADDSERGEFTAAARALAGWVTQERAQEIELDFESLEHARDRLFSMWNGPLGWVSYVGHGGLDRIADEGLLTSEDVASLSPMQSSPFVLGWSCNMARSDIPGFLSLGDKLLTAGAAAGVFSATGWSNHLDTDLLRTAFTEAAFASDAETIGDAMIRAHEAASDAPVEFHRVYMLLGDPALRLRVRKAAPAANPVSVANPSPVSDPGSTASEAEMNASVSGCVVARYGAGSGPFELALFVVCTLWLNRRRRA